MFRTLRARFILSHTLPVLVIVPLLGLALIYVVERQVVLADLASELEGEAVLVADIASKNPAIFQEPAQARLFVSDLDQLVAPQVQVYTPAGGLLATTINPTTTQTGQTLNLPGLAKVLAGKDSVQTSYSSGIHTLIVDVFVPVVDDPTRQILGAIELRYERASVYDRFLRVRYLVIGVLASGLLVGALIGLVVAVNTGRPLWRVTAAVYNLTHGQPSVRIPEQGPVEINLLAQAFNSLAERLELLHRSQRQFLANVVHELGRPLGAVGSAIQALRRGADDDRELREELLAGMDEELIRLARLLDDLSRLYGQVEVSWQLQFHRIALSDWLPRILALRRPLAEGKGLQWEVKVPPALPTLDLDPDRLGQALDNLLSNAIKYTPSGGIVTVSAGVKESAVWIRVSDTGPGITLVDQEHIFTPFYRGQSVTRFPEGMGLGLPIAHDLIAAHGGRLEVSSTPGRGSSFTLWLPATPAQH